MENPLNLNPKPGNTTVDPVVPVFPVPEAEPDTSNIPTALPEGTDGPDYAPNVHPHPAEKEKAAQDGPEVPTPAEKNK